MTDSKREPPSRPTIKKREQPLIARPKGETRRNTIEVEADWIEEVEIKPAKEPAAAKSSPSRPSGSHKAARKSIPPRASVPPAKSPPRTRSGSMPAPKSRPAPVPETAGPPPQHLSRPRGKLAPTIPREDEDSEPPPRRRSKPPVR